MQVCRSFPGRSCTGLGNVLSGMRSAGNTDKKSPVGWSDRAKSIWNYCISMRRTAGVVTIRLGSVSFRMPLS